MAPPIKDKNQIKIFILYLIEKIGYPLSYNTIASIVLQDGVVDFFDFSECFYELVDAGLIDEIKSASAEKVYTEDPAVTEDSETSLYTASFKGKQVALGLSDSIMRGVRERSYRSALRHLSFEKSGAVVDHTFENDGKHYLFKCSIKDREGRVMDVSVRVDDEKQLERMRTNYTLHPEVVYRGLIALLTGDVNYIFEE